MSQASLPAAGLAAVAAAPPSSIVIASIAALRFMTPPILPYLSASRSSNVTIDLLHEAPRRPGHLPAVPGPLRRRPSPDPGAGATGRGCRARGLEPPVRLVRLRCRGRQVDVVLLARARALRALAGRPRGGWGGRLESGRRDPREHG